MIKKIIKKALKQVKQIYKNYRNKRNKIFNDNYFLLEDKAYLASADQFEGIKQIVEAQKLLQCKNFFSVIGGLGGLNVLARLEQLDSITFFDLNPIMPKICELLFKIIKSSENRYDFISLIFLRNFLANKYYITNQEEYYSQPIDKSIIKRLEKILGVELFNLYMKVYYPYILTPMIDKYDGFSVHCTKLKIFHEALRNEVMTYPFFSRKELIEKKLSCTNSFFFGQGWLKNDERFDNVKKHLSNPSLFIIEKSIFDLDFKPFSGLYASNVLEEEWNGFAEIIYKFSWVLMFNKESQYLKLEYKLPGDRLIPIIKVYGSSESDTHKSCCELLDDHFKLNNSHFLEIIQPHISEGMVFGFRFYSGHIPINVNEFINSKSFNIKIPDIIGIHMLMGNGCTIENWKNAIIKALELEKEIFIFEHRKDCTDWPEWDVNEELILSEIEIDKFLLSLNDKWKKYGVANKYGEANDIRNLCWILKK